MTGCIVDVRSSRIYDAACLLVGLTGFAAPKAKLRCQATASFVGLWFGLEGLKIYHAFKGSIRITKYYGFYMVFRRPSGVLDESEVKPPFFHLERARAPESPKPLNL